MARITTDSSNYTAIADAIRAYTVDDSLKDAQYKPDEMPAGIEKLATDKWNEGRDVGRADGFEEGYQDGYDNGFDKGKTEGTTEGKQIGFEEGYTEAEDTIASAFALLYEGGIE